MYIRWIKCMHNWNWNWNEYKMRVARTWKMSYREKREKNVIFVFRIRYGKEWTNEMFLTLLGNRIFVSRFYLQQHGDNDKKATLPLSEHPRTKFHKQWHSLESHFTSISHSWYLEPNFHSYTSLNRVPWPIHTVELYRPHFIHCSDYVLSIRIFHQPSITF